jgi:hypothetical protein
MQHARRSERLHRDRAVELGSTTGRLVGCEAAPQPLARVGHHASFLPIRFTWNACRWPWLFHVEQHWDRSSAGLVTVLPAS